MDINQIETDLASPDLYQRLKAVTELRNYDGDVAIPLLLTKKKDPEFLVRSFVAMGLGKKQTADSFAALLEIIKFDRDSNVRAEAANSLSLFGKLSAPHLLQAFCKDDNWLVRISILAALMELNCPDELFDACVFGVRGEEPAVKEAAINGLAILAGTIKGNDALEQILNLVEDPSWRVRVQVAKALGKFDHPQAQAAREQLKKDEDHRVVAAALEEFIK